MEKSHCILIKRDRKWFNEKIPKFAAFWDEVLEYRNIPEKKQELIDLIAAQEAEKERKKQEKREKERQEMANAASLMEEDD